MAAAWAVLGLFLLGATVLWTIGWHRGRAACDQYDYHLKVIVKFARELPHPDLHDYYSATTPGYHLVLAAAARMISENPLFLQITASAFTLALLLVFGRAVGRAGQSRGRTWIELIVLALPFATSTYVFTSGVWLLPENAGWWLALLVALPCLCGRINVRSLAWCSALLVLLVLVRQSHLWVASFVCGAAWMSSTPMADASIAGALSRPAARVRPTLAALAACLPAAGILAVFVWMWHGLTPPSFHVQHLVQSPSHINWATLPFILSLVAVFSPFFLGWLWPGIVRLWRESRPAVVLIAFASLVWAILPETTFLREPRSGGLWAIVEKLDNAGLTIAHHTSPLILLLAPIGAVLLAAWVTIIDDKRRWIVAASVGAFIAAQSLNANCWQRYHEPFLLMLFALLSAAYGSGPETSGTLRRPKILAALRIVGPLALAGLMVAVTIRGLIVERDPLLPEPKQANVSSPHDPAR